MTRVSWDDVGDRLFETGTDRGMLYPAPPGCPEEPGVPWNGLLSVDVINVASAQAMYFDGVKTFDYVTPGDFEAKLKALTYPNEFNEFNGYDECEDGIYLANQNRGTFGLSYRSLIGNDVAGKEYGYKIHIMYNLTAIPEDVTYSTLDSNIEPSEFAWGITGVPEIFEGFRPTAYVVIDSTKVDDSILSYIENTLYGSSIKEPKIIMPSEIIGMIDADVGFVL